MGPRMKLPRYVHGFVDRHGKPRFYFRRPGFESVPLPGLPYSPEFMRAYEAAVVGQARPRGAARTRPGTMAALALSYFASPQFSALRSSSRYVYRRTIERLCKDHGDRRAADLRRDHVVKLMSRLAGKPHAANTLRRALRNLMTHAIDIGIRDDDPTRDVKAIRIKTAAPRLTSPSRGAQLLRLAPTPIQGIDRQAMSARASTTLSCRLQHARGSVEPAKSCSPRRAAT